MKILFFGLEIHQHQHKEIQNQNGSGIHNDLHRQKKFSIQQDEQAGHMQKKREQSQPAVHGISQRHSQNPCDDTHKWQNKQKRSHIMIDGSAGSWVAVVDRDSGNGNGSRGFFPFFFLIMGIQIFFGVIQMALCRFRRAAACQRGGSAYHGWNIHTFWSSPSALTGQASTQYPQNTHFVMSM